MSGECDGIGSSAANVNGVDRLSLSEAVPTSSKRKWQRNYYVSYRWLKSTTSLLLLLALLAYLEPFSKHSVIDNLRPENAMKIEEHSVSPIDNPTLLSQNTPKLWIVSSANEVRFELPTDIEWIRKWPGMRSFNSFYLRDAKEIEERGKQGSCTGVLDVLDWLMSEVNDTNNGCLMIAYGELIHMHREKDFVNNMGQFLDDDIDTWVSLETVARIASLEPELFRRFGWTVRAAVVRGQFVTLAQIVASCGLNLTTRTGKIISSQPAIEMYPIVTIPDQEKERNIVKDLWQGNLFPESMMFPRKNVTFISAGTHHPLQLQLPNQPEPVMECLYGNWRLPSGRHSLAFSSCFDKSTDMQYSYTSWLWFGGVVLLLFLSLNSERVR